jgi:predicted methyltransferase
MTHRPFSLTPDERSDASRGALRGWPAFLVLFLMLIAIGTAPFVRGAEPAGTAGTKAKPANAKAKPVDGKARPPGAKAKPDGAKAKPDDAKAKADDAKAKADDARKAKERSDAVRGLAQRLGIGPGMTIADIGAGNGADAWTFADIVGPGGTVYAEEVGEGLVKTLKGEAEKRKLPQVRAVLGRDDDPALPAGAVDLVHMRLVYHHFSQPHEMLRGIWRSLKPGGHLAIVDQRKGTLREYVPRAERKGKHVWTGETTVVREAREAGFAFVACADESWYEKEPFVLVFQRPRGAREPGADPDPFLALAIADKAPLFLPLARPYARPVFIAVGEARGLIGPILGRSSGPGLEIVLEEWATQKDERQPLPANVSLPAVLTAQGDPRLGPEPIDAVFFLDSYHLLFHGPVLLAKLRERLAPAGVIYILDREAQQPLSRREASHRRRLTPDMVKRELAAAGFALWFTGPRLAADRFLLVFGKTAAAQVGPESDPCLGGPEIRQAPATWLQENAWRLRGLTTVDGKRVLRQHPGQPLSVAPVAGAAGGRTVLRLAEENLLLSFDQQGGTYRLVECRPAR